MPTTPADVVHVAHLIVTTIPVTADDSSGLVMVDFATPISRTYRLAEIAPTHLIDINGDRIAYPTIADIDADVETLADWEQKNLISADAARDDATPEQADEPPAPAKTEPATTKKPTPPSPSTSRTRSPLRSARPRSTAPPVRPSTTET